MRTTTRPVRLISLAVSLLACGGATAPVPDVATDVLFIGNSLTYFNDLPGILEDLFAATNRTAYVASVAQPNFGLEDHWNRGEALDSIRKGNWGYVIMQQGPSATEGRPSLLEWSARFADSIRAVGAEPGMYMVWPAESRSFDFPGVASSYRQAANDIGGLLFPVGEAWALVWERDSGIELYGPDRFHPTTAASYLAAVIVFSGITGDDPTGLPGDVAIGLGIPGATISVIHEAAKEAVRRSRNR